MPPPHMQIPCQQLRVCISLKNYLSAFSLSSSLPSGPFPFSTNLLDLPSQCRLSPPVTLSFVTPSCDNMATTSNEEPVPSPKSVVAEKDGVLVESSDSATPSISDNGSMILVPQPSDDPRDPLNWTMSKKIGITLTLGLALFLGFCAPFNGQVQIAQQALLYNKSTVEITYFVSLRPATP